MGHGWMIPIGVFRVLVVPSGKRDAWSPVPPRVVEMEKTG